MHRAERDGRFGERFPADAMLTAARDTFGSAHKPKEFPGRSSASRTRRTVRRSEEMRSAFQMRKA